jgi:glycosyltransferase involved in cell wall biosynthesis
MISVLLPAKNAAATLERAAGSVLAQTFTDFELWLIDDGSSDDTAAVMERLARADGRVRRLSTGGVGLVGALSLGLAHARRPFIARMDADDESHPTRFARSLEALEEDPTLSGVGTGVEIFRDDRPVSPSLAAYGRWLSSLTTPERVFTERLVESPLCHPSVLLRRRALEAVGGWREGPFPEDWELWLRLLERGHRLRCVGEVLHRWRDHDARLTRTDARYAWARHVELRGAVLARRLEGQPVVIAGGGRLGVGLLKGLLARGVVVERVFDVNPRRIGQHVHGVPVRSAAELGPPGQAHGLMAVGTPAGREELRGWFARAGWLEGRHFTCAG